MILLAASLAMLAVIARGIERMLEAPSESRATRLTRTLLWAIAVVVVVEAGLGALGLLTARATFFALSALALACAASARRRATRPREARDPLSPADVAVAAALIAALVPWLWAGLDRTAFLYDALSYHLHVPVTWMQDQRIGIVPAVFGDPSPAYAPSNVELVFLFVMAPLRSDFLAGVGQVPFGALAVAAIVAAVREAAGRRTAALGAALAFVLIPEVWAQIPTAMSDVGLAACLLAALPFALRLCRAPTVRPADLLAFATAIGLAAGSKYAGGVLVLPLLAAVAVALLRNRGRLVTVGALGRALALLVAVVLATGGFWYLRNAVVTGNPVYPIALGGLPLPALYGRAEMRAWEYHVPVHDLRAFGAMLIAAGIGFASAAALALVRRWRNLEALLLVASLALFWLVIPYQESRFLFAAFGLAAVAIGRAADRPPAVVGWGGLAVAVVGSLIEWSNPERLRLVPAAIAGAIGAAIWRRLSIRPNARAAATTTVVATIGVLAALALGHDRYLARDPGYIAADDAALAADWSWFRAHVRDARVAYTGTNLAFPLAGERLANRVRYVNVAGAPGDRLHDFGPPGDGTAEPAPYRRRADPDVWLANLRAVRTQVLFVAALYPIVRRTIAADADGFPIERAWADARPGAFRLLHASPAARIYAVELQ